MAEQFVGDFGGMEGGAETLDVRVPSASGKYMQLAREEKLEVLDGLVEQQRDLEKELSEVEQELKNFKDREWLLQRYRTLRREGKRFEDCLPQYAENLEKQKIRIRAQLEEVCQRIREIDPYLLETGQSAGDQVGKVSPTTNSLTISRRSDPLLIARDVAAWMCGPVPIKKVCGKLDIVCGKHSPSVGLPENWTKKYGVETYSDAYKHPRLRNSVQKMISCARRSVFELTGN